MRYMLVLLFMNKLRYIQNIFHYMRCLVLFNIMCGSLNVVYANFEVICSRNIIILRTSHFICGYFVIIWSTLINYDDAKNLILYSVLRVIYTIAFVSRGSVLTILHVYALLYPNDHDQYGPYKLKTCISGLYYAIK